MALETVVEPFIKTGLEPYVTIFTLMVLGMNGSFVAALLWFVEHVGNPEYDDKVFKKTIWYKDNGNSKKSK